MHCELEMSDQSMNKRAALFLDRDGVINVDDGYVHEIASFRFLDGIFALCRGAKAAGLAICVVTNQAGIGRGYYTEQDFHDLTDWMLSRFAAEGVGIDGVYFCPFHPTHGIGRYRAESPDRKPAPGMILRAAVDHNLDLTRSILIGDKDSDIAAAKNAGIGTTVLLNSQQLGVVVDADLIMSDLSEVTKVLFSEAMAPAAER